MSKELIHPLAEILAIKLSNITKIDTPEQKQIVEEAIKDAVEFHKIEIKRWYTKGFNAGRRLNPSGCCCEINEHDEIVSPCLAHLNWKDGEYDGNV
jgi:hypothetical protein